VNHGPDHARGAGGVWDGDAGYAVVSAAGHALDFDALWLGVGPDEAAGVADVGLILSEGGVAFDDAPRCLFSRAFLRLRRNLCFLLAVLIVLDDGFATVIPVVGDLGVVSIAIFAGVLDSITDYFLMAILLYVAVIISPSLSMITSPFRMLRMLLAVLIIFTTRCFLDLLPPFSSVDLWGAGSPHERSSWVMPSYRLRHDLGLLEVVSTTVYWEV
jgi:hypothetical protein